MAAKTLSTLPLRSTSSVCCHRILPCARLASQSQARRPQSLQARFPARIRAFGTSAALQEKKYTRDHEWLELSDDGSTGTIGVSVYAAKNLGDVVFVELPNLDLEVNAGDSIGAVESVKSASDIMTPVSGKIVEVNNTLEHKPGTINQGPEGEGWIAKIQLAEKGKSEMGELMNDVEYGQFVAE